MLVPLAERTQRLELAMVALIHGNQAPVGLSPLLGDFDPYCEGDPASGSPAAFSRCAPDFRSSRSAIVNFHIR
jgi:hypothetical protein